MKTRAEQAALNAYPKKERLNEKGTGKYDPNVPRRIAYAQGYEQAEKDTIKRAKSWLNDIFSQFDITDCGGHTIDIDTFVRRFLRYMEEEQ